MDGCEESVRKGSSAAGCYQDGEEQNCWHNIWVACNTSPCLNLVPSAGKGEAK